jgi:hypothetical protein
VLIQGEIDLYRIREEYEKSVGRGILVSYKKRALRHERDTLVARLNVSSHGREARRRRRRAE